MNLHILADLRLTVLFSILFLLSSLILLRVIRDIVLMLKKTQLIKLEYATPYISSIRTYDISFILIVFSQFLYLLIYPAYSFSFFYGISILINIFLTLGFMSFFIFLFILLGFAVRCHFSYREKKELIYKLLRKVYTKEESEKAYYYQIYSDLKRTKIIKAGVLSKLITGFSVIFTVVSIM